MFLKAQEKERKKMKGYAEGIPFQSRNKIKLNILAENKHLRWKMVNLCPIAPLQA